MYQSLSFFADSVSRSQFVESTLTQSLYHRYSNKKKIYFKLIELFFYFVFTIPSILNLDYKRIFCIYNNFPKYIPLDYHTW